MTQPALADVIAVIIATLSRHERGSVRDPKLATENTAIPHPSQVKKTAVEQHTTAAALRGQATKQSLSEDL